MQCLTNGMIKKLRIILHLGKSLSTFSVIAFQDVSIEKSNSIYQYNFQIGYKSSKNILTLLNFLSKYDMVALLSYVWMDNWHVYDWIY